MAAPKVKIVKEIRELQEVTDHPLDMCAQCEGCEIRKHLDVIRKLSWEKHRHTFTFLIHRCNRYPKGLE
jgi:hypothetical protein